MKPTRWILGAMLATTAVPPPVEVARDSSGRYYISLGAGLGEYESKHFGCTGNLVSSDPVELRSTGVRADYRPDRSRTRLTGFAGQMWTTSPDPDAYDYEGPFGGFQVAHEGRRFGIGIGWTHVPGEEGFDFPSIYVRAGSLNGPHFQVDVLPPEETLGMSGFARMGIGFNRGDRRGLGGLIGVSAMPYTYLDLFEPRLFGDFRLPVTSGLDVQFGAQVGHGAERTQWAATAGLGVRF